jgi:sugar phosphate isomerase/epimerase
MTPNIKIGFLPREGFEHWKPEDICRELSKIGYQGVEWSRHHFKPREMSPSQLKLLSTIPNDFDMQVSEIFIALDYVVRDETIRRDNIELTKECIAAAAEIGIHTVNVSPGPQRWVPGYVRIPEEMSEGTAWDLVFDAFDQILPVAESHKVYLALEGVWGMVAHDYYSSLPFFLRYNSEYLGINMDPSHGNLCRNDISWVIKQWGSRIRHSHLKDSVGLPGHDGDSFIFPMVGEGQVDWKSFFTAMQEIGYKGFYSVEFESFFYYNKVLKGDMLAAANISWKNIQALIGGDHYDSTP